MSGSEVDSADSFGYKPDQLCGMGLHIVPLPALITVGLSPRLFVNYSEPQRFPVFGKPFEKVRKLVLVGF